MKVQWCSEAVSAFRNHFSCQTFPIIPANGVSFNIYEIKVFSTFFFLYKRPTSCINHDVLELSCQYPLANLPISWTAHIKENILIDWILLTHYFLEDASNKTLNHSKLWTQQSHKTWAPIYKLEASLFLDFEVLSALTAVAGAAGRSSEQTDCGSLCWLLPGDCWPHRPITCQD